MPFLFSGDGVGKVALIVDEPDELQHWSLLRCIKRAGLAREQFLYGLPTPGWLEELHTRGVEVVMPLGETALRRVTGETDIKRWRGRVVPCANGLWSVPSWKASRLLHRRQIPGVRDPDILQNPPRHTGQLIRDLHLALDVAKNGYVREPVEYLEDPPVEVFQVWAAGYLASDAPYLSFDIETPYKQKNEQEDDLDESEAAGEMNRTILRISFAYEPLRAVTVPWAGPYLPTITQLLSADRPKLVWNGFQFDVPVIETNGYQVNGTILDGMDAWHVWQSDLPKGLEAVSADCTSVLPWKHLTDSNPTWYSAADADVALRNFLHIEKKLKQHGMWDAYMQDSVILMPILKEAGQRGNALDMAKQADLRMRFEAKRDENEAQIQDVVNPEDCPRKRYKRQPFPDGTAINAGIAFHEGRRFEAVQVKGEVKVCTNCGVEGVTKGDHTAKKSLGKALKAEKHHAKKCRRAGALWEAVFTPEEAPCECPKGWPKKEWDITPNPCHGARIAVEMLPVTQWDEILPFNAGSSQQLMQYMRAHKHPVGQAKDDSTKETADSKHLTYLSKRYGSRFPLYGLALEHHRINKAISTYLWKPGPDGRVHTTYVNSPSTWRLGSRAVNLQNVPKREANIYAKEARQQIVASPGCKLVQADSTSIEAIFLGWEMGDLDYIDRANQSVHAWLCCVELGLPFTPENVDLVKEKHKNLYNQMKVANHMTNYGGSAYILWQLFPDYFPTKLDAERVQQKIFTLLPGLQKFHYHVRHSAQKQGYIQSVWGHRHYFYDVFVQSKDRFGNLEWLPNGLPKHKVSKDGKRAVAFKPQHGAGVFMRRNLVMLGQSKWREFMPANVTCHDAYTLDVPDPLVPEAVDYLAELITRPIPEMGGLRVGCEVEVGENWGDYNDDPKKGSLNLAGMQTVRRVVIDKQELAWIPTVLPAAA